MNGYAIVALTPKEGEKLRPDVIAALVRWTADTVWGEDIYTERIIEHEVPAEGLGGKVMKIFGKKPVETETIPEGLKVRRSLGGTGVSEYVQSHMELDDIVKQIELGDYPEFLLKYPFSVRDNGLLPVDVSLITGAKSIQYSDSLSLGMPYEKYSLVWTLAGIQLMGDLTRDGVESADWSAVKESIETALETDVQIHFEFH